MTTLTWLALGLALGAGFVIFAGIGSPARERHLYALGLLIAAALYAVFALIRSSPVWVAIELAGIALFGLFVWLGRRRSPMFVGAGWLLHPVWDGGLHLWGPGVGVAPEWYVLVCLSFDLLVGIAILVRSRQSSARVAR